MSARDALIALLSDADAYPDKGAVERRETHISDVFLNPQHAYKLLKPVKFDFLDFSTREARYEECWNEVRLNRRLAADVYLGVVPVTETGGSLQLGGAGRPVDWLVKMRRLPDEATLYASVEASSANRSQIDRVLSVLIPFFETAPTGPEIAASGSPSAIRKNTIENLDEIRQHAEAGRLDRPAALRLRSAQLQLITFSHSLFERRVAEGWIRDGHGDLKAEHFYLVDDVKVVDCIAFNDRYRYVDTLDEICFLCTDLERFGRPDLSQYALAQYCRAMRDAAPAALAAFYTSYRYSVRAKVSCLRAQEQTGEEQSRTFEEAGRYVASAVQKLDAHHRPLLIVFCGMTGSGKSTVAKQLAQRIGAQLVASDVVRKRLFGMEPLERSADSAIYSSEANFKTYAELQRLARESLEASITVILDATFIRRRDRAAVCELAGELDVPMQLVECRCPVETAEARITKRQTRADDASDAGLDVLRLHAKNFEAVTSAEAAAVITLDTREPLSDLVAQIVTRLAVL